MKKTITFLTLLLLLGGKLFSQGSLSKEELINLRNSRTYKDECINERNNSNRTPYLWEYVIDNNPNGNEEFSFCDAKELSNGNIGVASSFYYRSGYGDFYSAHPAVAVISRDGEEIARNSFFRPGYTTTSSAPYLFEKEGKLFALSTDSPEHDYLSFNYFQN